MRALGISRAIAAAFALVVATGAFAADEDMLAAGHLQVIHFQRRMRLAGPGEAEVAHRDGGRNERGRGECHCKAGGRIRNVDVGR